MELPIVKTLSNKLTVALVPFKGIDSVTIHLKGLVGSNYEKPNQIGVAHLLEHIKISQNKEIISKTGGKVIGVSSRDNILFMSKTLKQNYTNSLQFLSKILQPANISKNKLDVTKKIVINELNRYYDFPEKMIGRLSYRLLFENQRLAKLNIGDNTDINKITTKALKHFEDDSYKPSNFVLVACGNLDKEEYFLSVDKLFGTLKAGVEAPKLQHKQSSKFNTQSINVQNYEQAFVKISYYGIPLNKDSHYTLKLFSMIVNAHLLALLREKFGFSYKTYCNSFSAGSYGVFSIYFSSDQNNVKESVELIKESLLNLELLVTENNLEATKSQYATNLVFNLEKVSQRADYYSEYLLHGHKKQNHEYELEYIENVSVKDVLRVAKEVLNQKPKIIAISRGLSNDNLASYWG